MIKTQKLVSEVYYKESRDFQFFGRLYDVVFNYLKTEIDLINTFPLKNTQDTSFVELLLKTLGFKKIREYQINQLLPLASIWIDLIKNKGSLTAIENLIQLILRAENITGDYSIEFESDRAGTLPTIIIKIRDLISSQESALLEEALNYIMPIGMTYIIQDVSILDSFTPMDITMEENLSANTINRKDISRLAEGGKVKETLIPNMAGYTGTFTDRAESEQEENIINQGSIKVGVLAKSEVKRNGKKKTRKTKSNKSSI